MSVAIVERTVDVAEKRVTLKSAEMCRPISLGTAWSRLRICLRLAVNATSGASTQNELFVGLVSNPNYAWAGAYCEHAVGALFDTVLATSATNGTGIGYGYFVKKVGQTVTQLNTTALIYTSAVTTIALTNTTPRNCCMAFEIAKKSGDIYAMAATGGRSSSTSTYASKTREQFWTAVPQPSISAVAACWSTSYTGDYDSAAGAVDEAGDGDLTYVSVYWRQPTNALEISDVDIARIE